MPRPVEGTSCRHSSSLCRKAQHLKHLCASSCALSVLLHHVWYLISCTCHRNSNYTVLFRQERKEKCLQVFSTDFFFSRIFSIPGWLNSQAQDPLIQGLTVYRLNDSKPWRYYYLSPTEESNCLREHQWLLHHPHITGLNVSVYLPEYFLPLPSISHSCDLGQLQSWPLHSERLSISRALFKMFGEETWSHSVKAAMKLS